MSGIPFLSTRQAQIPVRSRSRCFASDKSRLKSGEGLGYTTPHSKHRTHTGYPGAVIAITVPLLRYIQVRDDAHQMLLVRLKQVREYVAAQSLLPHDLL